MGKILGGGSSINIMVWARGHQRDWDFFASKAHDPAWSYDSALEIYRRIEDWHGTPDPKYRGTGGPVFVQPAPDPNPLASATVDGARAIGIPTFENPNGRMMEGRGGASISDMRARDGKRKSVFRSYTYPYMDRPNLTVLTHAYVNRLTFDGTRVTGVEISYQGTTRRIGAAHEVVLSLGAIHTPKVLMQSGVGDQVELRRFGIPVLQHLPGVGQNFQDHVGLDCVWEYRQALPPRNTMSEAILFWKSTPGLEYPDLFMRQAEVPKSTDENATRFGLPEAGRNPQGRPQTLVHTDRAFEVTGDHRFRLITQQTCQLRPGAASAAARRVCHTDVLTVEGVRADPSSPAVARHEIASMPWLPGCPPA